MSIMVAQGQERFVKALAEYTEDQSINKIEYVTGQNTNGQKRALDSVIYGLAAISTANQVGVNSTKRIIKKVAHGARKNDVVQFTSGASEGVSVQILSCPDADTLILASTSEFAISSGDTFDIKRYVTPQYASDGSLSVVATQGPSKYILDNVDTEVEEDTADPTNNRAFPSKLFIQKDGETIPVNKDTGVPANTAAIPVEIVGVSGQEINITAGDINIQTTSEGVSFDSMRIGSGVGLYAEITANSELSTHDEDALDAINAVLTELQSVTTAVEAINTKTPALGQALEAASTPVVLPATQIATLTPPAAITGFALETTQQSVKTAVEAINTKTPALGQALDAASVPVVLTAAQILTLTPPAAITGFATETTLSAMSAKLPATLGPKTPALSLAVVQAVNASGSIVNTTLTATTATSNTAPSNAVGFFIEADSANTDPIRWAIGSTASTTVGNRLEPGRSGDGFIPCVGAVSVCAEVSGTNKYSIQWILSV